MCRRGVKSVILEYPDPIGPWGLRGMAEMPFLPLAPAIAAAIYDATGVWIDSQPFTPQKVVGGAAPTAGHRRALGPVSETAGFATKSKSVARETFAPK